MAAAEQLLRLLPPCGRTLATLIYTPRRLNPPANPILPTKAMPLKPFDSPCRSPRRRWLLVPVPKASPEGDDAGPAGDDDGVSLGTMKLPPNTDLTRFETLLFQPLQGATQPLPVPLKVDRVRGGARLGFVKMGDGEVEVPVYIDCFVVPASGGAAGPMFRAVRNGPQKDEVAPGEQRIMRSLLEALQKSVQIATAA
ncbi:unnamed protein product [Spirodela intermedia]|uniref:DUF7148 domain-containing protein n=1 Tax=Spirodela intermedia TaxID=51605 RepID=A0A7I8IS88_SPIIN|nr:unnamed protein product [Spirodela intermedia]CAA6660646.1 unnamed protein product [Spirodela intermedia]